MSEHAMKCVQLSNNPEWDTPISFYKRLDKEFGFTLDPCCDEYNHKCEKYFTIVQNGLIQSWQGEKVFMNPPYGRDIPYWVRKAYNESIKGCLVVGLLPARTDTQWFHDYCMKSSEIRLVKGRLKFGDGSNSAPFPSLVCVWDGKNYEPRLTTMKNYEELLR